MIAAEIAAALGNACREGRNWRAPCPVHGGKSLALADGHDGKLLIYCFGGCEAIDVFNELRALGLIDGRHDDRSERQAELVRRHEAATKIEAKRLRRRVEASRNLYRRTTPAVGTLVETYLWFRGITIPLPPVLRCLRSCPHRNGRYYPAMLAQIVNVVGEQLAIHKTFLRPDGSGKADLPKDEQREVCGPMRGGAVQLAPAAETLMVGEGIETCLAAMEATGLPAWAALSTSGVVALVLPSIVRNIICLADNDSNGAGERAARLTAERWLAEGRRVRIALPPEPGSDFNDVLMSRANGETRDVAA
jgi:hypothetical protein